MTVCVVVPLGPVAVRVYVVVVAGVTPTEPEAAFSVPVTPGEMLTEVTFWVWYVRVLLWPAVMFGYMTTLAYVAAFITFHVAAALGAG